MTHKIATKISLLLAFLFMVFCGTTLSAQNKVSLLNGVVHDEYGKPLAGVIVNSDKGKNRSYTNEQGEYSLLITDGSKSVVFSFIGYKDQKIAIGDNKQLNANLKADYQNLDETVQLGYSNQKRSDLTGAVATASGEELKKSPVANLTMTFDGRFPGLFTQETSSELSRANTNLYVRGISSARMDGPLVVIDGIPTSYNSNQSLDYISPAEIESVSVLKDASTEAIYGIEGANGVIVITTKRGQKGGLKVNVRLDESLQQVTTKPTFINSAEYATLRNEASVNDGKGTIYSDQQIAAFKSGSNPQLYPNTNWYDLMMKKFAQMQRANVDLQGGNERVQYFTDINIMHQGSQFKADQSAYDSNENFTWANIRSNVNMKLNSYLGAYLNLSGNIKRERTPGGGLFSNSIYSNLFTIPSAVYGPLTPSNTIDPNSGEKGGNQVISTNLSDSPYGMLNRDGYTRHTVTNIYAQFGLNADLASITEGLKASGVFAYQTNSVNSLYTTENYEQWVRNTTTYPDTLVFNRKGTNTNSTLNNTKGSSYYYYLTYKAMLNYDRDFGLNHISGMAYAYYQNLSTADTGSPQCLPYKRLHTGLEATYNYDQKYLLKYDMGYSGSDQYAPGNRFTLTPAISAGWVVSKEDFMSNLNWLSTLKLRASYGKTANDQCGLNRFTYLDDDTYGQGGPIGSLQYMVYQSQVGNPKINPEISKKQNYGIDLGFFDELSLSIDVFKEKMDNMIISATANIPNYQGVPLGNYPATNSGSFENKGYEVVANYTKRLNKDLTFSLGGFVSYAKNKVIEDGSALKTSDYAYRNWSKGYSYGQSFGYLVDYSNGNGFFNSQDEITNSKLDYKIGTPRVGDLKYKDLNNDGIIDEKDKAPLGTGTLPRYYYGFSGGLNYKSFDFSFLFQGIGEYKTIESGWGIYGTDYDGIFGSLLENAYTPARYSSGAKITAPALSLTTTTNQQASNYYLYNRAYLRLKNVEFGYTLPERVAQMISASKVRFVLSAQNLFTWDHMKSNDYGPEGQYGTLPVYRVYNVGLSLQF